MPESQTDLACGLLGYAAGLVFSLALVEINMLWHGFIPFLWIVFKEALIKEPSVNAQLSFGKARSFFEAGVDSSVRDCFEKSEASPPNGINQRFLKYTVHRRK